MAEKQVSKKRASNEGVADDATVAWFDKWVHRIVKYVIADKFRMGNGVCFVPARDMTQDDLEDLYMALSNAKENLSHLAKTGKSPDVYVVPSIFENLQSVAKSELRMLSAVVKSMPATFPRPSKEYRTLYKLVVRSQIESRGGDGARKIPTKEWFFAYQRLCTDAAVACLRGGVAICFDSPFNVTDNTWRVLALHLHDEIYSLLEDKNSEEFKGEEGRECFDSLMNDYKRSLKMIPRKISAEMKKEVDKMYKEVSVRSSRPTDVNGESGDSQKDGL